MLIALNIGVYVLVQPHGSRSILHLPRARSSLEFGRSEELRFTLAYAAIPCEVVHDRPLRTIEVASTFGDRGNEQSCGVVDAGDTPLARLPAFPSKRPYLSLLTSMFLHGGLLHLAGNMLFLWIFGNNIEDRFGRVRYLAFYLIGGFVAAVAHIAVQPRSTIPIVGASGAIAAVMGAYLVLYPKAKVTTALTFFVIFVRKISAVWLLAFWFVSQFFLAPGSGVAWVAHVGGFVFGALVASVVRMIAGPGGPTRPSFTIGRQLPY